MHVTFTVKHVRRDADLDALFTREAERIVRRLSGVPGDSVTLHCELAANLHVKEAYASLTLVLPGATLNAKGVAPNAPSALRDATDELLVVLKRNRHQRLRRERRREAFRLGAMDDPASFTVELDGPVHEDLAAETAHTLPELRRFVRAELARHRAAGDGADAEAAAGVDAEDAVEEAVREALERREERPADVPFDRWLISCAYDVVLREEERVRSWRSRVSLDAKPLADLLARGRGADDEAAARDLRLAVLKAIRRLPGDSRRVLSLVALEGMAEREAAMRLHTSEQQIRETMDDARIALRSELTARGFEIPQSSYGSSG